jgi:ribosome-binding protein aMBF1 (putative translation factor)
MNKTKRSRLEARGWRVGSAKDFLGLSPEEAALVETRLALSQALRSRRVARGLTQGELARRLRSSQSRVAKMEAGDKTVSVDLLVRALYALGAKPRDVGRALQRRTVAAA